MKDKVQVKLFYNDENSEITDDQKYSYVVAVV